MIRIRQVYLVPQFILYFNDTGNNLCLGVYQGFISFFDVSKKKIIKNFKNPKAERTPCYFTRDNKNPNIIWYASYYPGSLFKLDVPTEKFTEYKHIPTIKDSWSNKDIFDIFQDGNYLWIATGGDGLCKFDKATGKCAYYKHDPNDENSISGNVVIQSFIDSKGNFWVTTDDSALNKFDKETGKFTNYGIDHGFPSTSTRHILEDKEGNLWISTDSGIVKFDTKLLKVVKHFTTADGLISNGFDRVGNPLKDSNGNFWFSGLGLCKFNPEEASKIEPNQHMPPIVLTSFKSKEGTYNEDGLKKLTEVKLPWPDNSFEFTFAALDYMDPEKNQYAYRLEGFDKDWKYIGTNNFGQYSNLNPGEYTLYLKGSNNDGIWNEKGISIKIIIIPPFWMTLWFKELLGIIAIFTILGLYFLRVRALKKKAIDMRNRAVAENVAQVAHDIRSPLAALTTVLKDLTDLPEQKRILVRSATNRISEIACNLLTKHKPKIVEGTVEQKHLKSELISSLLDHLVSEKRFQLSEKSIELILELDNNTHSCFVNLEPGKFKRVISNLINNAAEAIESKGIIRVVLSKESDADLVVKIVDNGKGIPENILSKIKQEIVTTSKEEGHGIGVSTAIQNIKSWGGSYDIQSKVGHGTTFIIKLPIAETPDWFQNDVAISKDKHIVVLDDDESIHNVWQTHFSTYLEKKLVTLNHFYNSLALREYCKTSRSNKDLFLVDYELANSKESGLDLIEQLDLKNQAILVTSRYEEPEIRERVEALGIKIIPKNFAPYVPILMGNKEDQPDFIFIDDEKYLTDVWEMHAAAINKKLITFNCSEDFKKVMNRYKKDIPIYIDSNLKEKLPGEQFAKFLYE